jgi:hypothetical protein
MNIENIEPQITAVRMMREAVMLLLICRPFRDALTFFAFDTFENQLQLSRGARSSDSFVVARAFILACK